jgi:integrase
VDSEGIESNLLRDLKAKSKSKALEEVDPLTEHEINLLLTQAGNYLNGTYYPPILCALRTGLRIGELQALQWGDVDFNGRFIEVKRSWRRGRLTDTKSKKRRHVDMTSHLVETLKALRLSQKKKALKSGYPTSEWVFDNGKGDMVDREVFRKALNKCLELAGLRRVRITAVQNKSEFRTEPLSFQ